MSTTALSALVADAASAAHGEARRMAYGMLANSVEATKEASVQFAADARCVEVCLRGLEAGDEAIRVAAAKCVKAAAKRAPAFRGALAKKGGIAPLVAMAETGSVEAAMRAAWALANLAMDSAANKTAIREGRGLAALVNLLRRQRAASPLAASSLRNYEGEALRERAAQGLDALCQGDAKNQEAVVLAGGAEPLVRLLRDSKATQMARLRAAFATYRLATSPANWRALGEAGAPEALAAAVDDHLRDGPSGPRGLHDDDGAVAAAAALALLPPKSGGEEAETWATQAVCEHLNKKLDDDKAGRAMRLRDFTLAARALSGRASAGERAEAFAKAAAPALVRCLLRDGWRTGGPGGESPEAYRLLCLGDCAESVLQLACVGDNTASILRTAGAVAALEKLKGETDGRLREAVRGAEHHLALGLIRSNSPIKSHSSKRYDVFLSHKQTDAKDFARALHTMLTLRRYKAFLDMEFDGSLDTLQEYVASSSVFAFILSENVLDSPWCVAELTAAVDSGVPVVVVKKEGSRWRDPNTGSLSLTFPGPDVLKKLPARVQQVFQIKIVEHSDVYYAPFIDKFFDRLEEAGLPPAEDPYALTTEELEAMDRGGRPRLRHMLSMMDGAAGRRPSLDRRSFDEDGSQPTSPASAAARRLDPLDEVTSAATAETLTVELDRRTLYVLAAIGAGAAVFASIGTAVAVLLLVPR